MNRKEYVLSQFGLGPRWVRRRQTYPAALASAAAEKMPAVLPSSAEMTHTERLSPAMDPAQPASSQLQQALSADRPAYAYAERQAQALPLAESPYQAVQLSPAQPPARALPPMDWATLEAEVKGCTRCRLCETRTQAVFGRGNPKARWLVVGEAPGEQEDRQGLPFVGRAGQLLNNMLRAAGLDSDTDVYIANVIKCRPPANRNPSQDEIAACQPYLRQQIDHIQPSLILALGRFAAQTLLETTEPIGRLRGKVHHYASTPLIVSYHPAYLLRTQPDKAKAWQDLVFARREMAHLQGKP